MKSPSALQRIQESFEEGARLRLQLAADLGPVIVQAAAAIVHCLREGGKLLFFGNGGSAADAQHLAAEFVGRFVLERPGLPAIALTTDSSILTAIGNDYGFDRVFSRQLEALAQPGDIAIGISTSGGSPNVLAAIHEARRRNLKTIGFSGKDGGELARIVDFSLLVPCRTTARVQECHITIGHILCELMEQELFAKAPESVNKAGLAVA